ncbi:serine/threonine protein kinase [Kribbella qitaiheensis]|uniref:serine/threonine protein kinase n=1 Tax=Kribbella qitaiheensis TaxID=1544730 RepID=UPI001628EBAE|nr:serine/threonine protein kinase [Kribbella qitaiheensis]
MIVEVPGYRLAEPLGAGATGVVYAANRLADGRSVAVKVVHPELVDPQYRDRLRREARLAAAVDHPGVVRVHAVGGDGDRAWLAMDRLSGPDLQRLLDDGGALPASRAVALLSEVAAAVDAMHKAGVIHRDLKPANIILDGDRPTVADFGVARQLVSLESSTGMDLSGGADWLRSGEASGPSLGAMAGTVAYMAPEQWRGEAVSAATDVYALGGTLFSLLTGRRPFDRRTLPELAYAVAMLPPPAPSAYGVPAGFDDVVRAAMAKEPGDRYPTAAAFADALRAAAVGEPSAVLEKTKGVSAGGGPQLVVKSGQWTRRRIGTLVAIVAPVLVIGGVGATVLAQGDAQSPDLTVCAQDATVRDAPRSRTVIATVHHGDRLTPIAPRDGAAWVHVRLPDGRTGWSLTDYVRHQC